MYGEPEGFEPRRSRQSSLAAQQRTEKALCPAAREGRPFDYEHHEEELAAALEMPDEALPGTALHDPVNDLVCGEVLLVARIICLMVLDSVKVRLTKGPLA